MHWYMMGGWGGAIHTICLCSKGSLHTELLGHKDWKTSDKYGQLIQSTNVRTNTPTFTRHFQSFERNFTGPFFGLFVYVSVCMIFLSFFLSFFLLYLSLACSWVFTWSSWVSIHKAQGRSFHVTTDSNRLAEAFL